MFQNGTLNPYKSPFSAVAKQFLKLQINPTYNCKVKSYPDGTQNICIAQSDIFGRNECNFVPSRDIWRDFKATTNHFHMVQDYEYMEYQRFKVLSSIDIYYKSVDTYLLCMAQSRAFDRQQIHDSLVVGGNSLNLDERAFLSSLRSSLRTDHLKQTRENIFDFVMCNEWEYFFTGTIDPKKYDSTNANKIKQPLKKWFNNMRERYGLSYICIFEYHKKGGIHLHGLIKSAPGQPLKLVPSDTKTYYGFKKPMKDSTAIKHGLDPKKGKIVYNLKTWRFGWSTAIKVYGSQAQLANYVTKYITKTNQKIMGRYFWHSQDLKRPSLFYMNTSYDDLHLPTYHGFKYIYEQRSNDLLREYEDILDYQEDVEDFSGWVDI